MELKQLGPYNIGRRLGKGGMGTVYQGTDAAGQSVAIKVLSALLASEEGFRERFTSEIETLRKLRHPNIVRLYGFGEQDGHLFYSMELVTGSSLEEELTHGRRFEWKEVVQMAIQMCRALKHAHDHGVIHRDIKPANVMLSADGQVKLSDFGIAKLFGNTGMTSTGGVLGTAEYMAPEQADGRPVTYRSDLYSLGGLIYALLAGRPPFQARSLPEMLQLQRFAQPEPVRHFAPQTPNELQEIVGELLSKDPEQRAANAMILARRLESMHHGLLARERRALEAGAGNAPQTEVDFTLSNNPPPPRRGQFDTTVDLDDAPSIDPLAETIGTTADYIPAAEPKSRDNEVTEYALADAPIAPPARSKLSQQPTLAAPELPPAVEISSEPVPAEPPRRRYTTVEEAEEEEAPLPSSPLWSVQTVLLVVALLGLIAAGYYLTRPKSADALYTEIATAADTGAPEDLAAVEPAIDDFLARYRDDRRAPEVLELKQRVDLDRQQRRYQRAARRGATGSALTPAERAYADAVRVAEYDPVAGAARLQALLDLFGATDTPAPDVEQCLALARQQLDKLQSRIGDGAAEQLQFIEAQLVTSEELAKTNRLEAEKTWNAIVALYGDKPWAAEVVARARANLTAPSTANP